MKEKQQKIIFYSFSLGERMVMTKQVIYKLLCVKHNIFILHVDFQLVWSYVLHKVTRYERAKSE